MKMASPWTKATKLQTAKMNLRMNLKSSTTTMNRAVDRPFADEVHGMFEM